MSLVPPEAWQWPLRIGGRVLGVRFARLPPGCFLGASRVKSQVTKLPEAWGDPQRAGDSNPIAVNRRVDLPEKELASW